MSGPHRSPVDVLVLLLREDQVLLMQRAGDAYGAGLWAVPSGKLEAGENVVAAVCREVVEELGVVVLPQDVEWFGVTQVRPPDGDARVGFAFRVSRWSGQPHNREPQLCSALQWWPLSSLPDPMMAYTLEVLRLHTAGEQFSVRGWEPRGLP